MAATETDATVGFVLPGDVDETGGTPTGPGIRQPQFVPLV
jgi:hypothetical protein